MRKHLIITILMLFVSAQASAQRETSHWNFGRFCSLDFNKGYPEITAGSQLSTREGTATMADANGNLLFYTDGVRVWDNENHVMPNGTDLLGNWSSAQSALICRAPASDKLYYIFTTDSINYNSHSLHYSLVDLTKNEGKGDVTQKNIPLLVGASEKLTGTYHKNKKDVWIVAHQLGTNRYLAYLITAQGINSPVVSELGLGTPEKVDTSSQDNNTENQRQQVFSNGVMKFSPQGDRLASVLRLTKDDDQKGGIELYDFDNETGQLSQAMFIDISSQYVSDSGYGLAFSPNGQFIYSGFERFRGTVPNSERMQLVQFDISLPTAAEIYSNRQVVSTDKNTFFAFQQAFDGKIYFTQNNPDKNALGIIHAPNKKGPDCSVQNFALALTSANGTRSTEGLPNFIQSFFEPKKITYSEICATQTVAFAHTFAEANLQEWDFGDPASGSQNKSQLASPEHIFNTPGSYTVQVSAYHNETLLGTESIQVRIYPSFAFSLGEDLSVCRDTSVQVLIASGPATYSWSTPTGTQTSRTEASSFVFEFGEVGQTTLQITPDKACPGTQTVWVQKLLPPLFELGNDRKQCYKTETAPAVQHAATRYEWNTGSVEPLILPTHTGSYVLTGTNKCGSYTDEVFIEVEYCGNVQIPNVVTPNQPTNNRFVLSNWEGAQWHLLVFNRWGRKLYDNPNFQNNWDNFNLKAGVYYYFLENKTQNKTHKGFFHVF